MHWPSTLLFAAFASVLSASTTLSVGAAPKQTVCTITVNSADEKEAFRRHLPAEKYQFVELVERGRSEWLASACQKAISCDVLVISGHYDGVNEFFSDRNEVQEHLPVDELERASCSESCPGLFSRLKEVHLYGCNTLNSEVQSSASAEVGRALVRDGRSLGEAQRRVVALNNHLGESSRDRMRQVFKNVPVIYGFSSTAPLGPTAAAVLNAYLRANGGAEIGRGRASSRLLGQFSSFGLSAARGVADHDPQAAVRRDVCRFADDRSSDANKLAFIHELLQQRMDEARFHLDRIERQMAVLHEPARRTAEVALALAKIAADTETRSRFLAFARDADLPAVRSRMVDVAAALGWLSAAETQQERALLMNDLHARKALGVTEVDLACALNRDRALDGTVATVGATAGPANGVAHTALRACLGHAEARARTLDALASANAADLQITRGYLRHRPIADAAEWQQIVERIARLPAPEAQVRALEALGKQHLSDPQGLAGLMSLYAQTSSWAVQAAIAGILIRSDRAAVTRPEFIGTLVRERLPAPPGNNMIDALLRRLQTS